MSDASEYPLAEQGDVCAVTRTACCAWVNTSGEGETQPRETTEQTSQRDLSLGIILLIILQQSPYCAVFPQKL